MLDRALIVALFLLICPAARPQGSVIPLKDDGAFRQKFAESSARTQTIEAAFTQEKNLSVLSEKIISKGKFVFKKENRLRWEYTEPFRYLILLNNGTMTIRDEAKDSKVDVRNNKMFAEINSIILGCVQGTIFNDVKKFSSSFFENQGSFIVKLKPLEPALKQYLSEIVILISKTDMTVSRLEMHEPSGDFTRIDFSGVRINSSIPDATFLAP